MSFDLPRAMPWEFLYHDDYDDDNDDDDDAASNKKRKTNRVNSLG